MKSHFSFRTLMLLLLCFSNLKAWSGFSVELEEPSPLKRNSVYFELFGNAGYLYNIGFDRIISLNEKSKIAFGAGIQYLPAFDLSADDIFSISPQFSFLYGVKHHFEAGTGVAIDFLSGDKAIPFRVGYRFQKPEGGLFLKAGIIPLFTNSFPVLGEGWTLVPWGGVSAGISF